MRIEELKKYRGRNPRGYFQDLPGDVRRRASEWLHRLMQKGRAERGTVPPWLFGIYVGQARRLALNPPTPAWGRSMLAKRGGLAVQRRYRAEGRVGMKHPARLVAKCRAKRQAAIKEARKPGAARHSFGNLTGI